MLGFIHRFFRTRDRRHHYRLEQPVLVLTIAGKEYATLNWSLGGFRIAAGPGRFVRDQRIEGGIRLPAGGDGSFAADVLRVTDQGQVQLRLLEISPAVFVAMSGLKGN